MTGPFKLGSFTPQGFTLVKNGDYWQASSLKVPKVFFPVYTSNTGALSALFAGQMLASEAEAGLENPVLNATGLTSPLYDAWSAPVASMTVSARADAAAAAAKQILQKAGYTMGSNGFFQKGGKTVSSTILDPSSYTDDAEVDSLVAQQLRAVGIDATFKGLSIDARQSLRDRSAVRNQQRSRFRHRRGGHPSPDAAVGSTRRPSGPAPGNPPTGGGPHPQIPTVTLTQLVPREAFANGRAAAHRVQPLAFPRITLGARWLKLILNGLGISWRRRVACPAGRPGPDVAGFWCGPGSRG